MLIRSGSGPRAFVRAGLLAAIAATVATLLAGCASQPVRTHADQIAGEQSPAERRGALEALAGWTARGRIALKTPDTGGQGSFIWTQAGDDAVIRVSGPFGAGAYEIRWSPARLTVVSVRGEVAADLAGPDAAEQFLKAQLGWALPVDSARRWLLGLPGPGSPAVTTTDQNGLLLTLEQGGWQMRYADYRREGGISLPRRLVLEHAGSRVRFVIDAWQL